jgi:hypothetical protein
MMNNTDRDAYESVISTWAPPPGEIYRGREANIREAAEYIARCVDAPVYRAAARETIRRLDATARDAEPCCGDSIVQWTADGLAARVVYCPHQHPVRSHLRKHAALCATLRAAFPGLMP